MQTRQFTFGGITHVIENPKEHAPGFNYGLVGSVPAVLAETRKWETVEQIKQAMAALPFATLCSSEACACRRLF